MRMKLEFLEAFNEIFDMNIDRALKQVKFKAEALAQCQEQQSKWITESTK